LLEDEEIIALDAASGQQRWSFVPDLRLDSAALDAASPLLYVADQLGRVEAVGLPAHPLNDDSETNGEGLATRWQVDLDVVGIPQLVPLPGGGVLLTVWDDAVALAPDGTILWQDADFDRPFDWLASADQLLLSTVGGERSLHRVDASGLIAWPATSGGALAAGDENVLLFNEEGLLALDPADLSSTVLSDWPRDSMRASDLIAVDDGGAVVSHFSRTDRRLIHFDSMGDIIWQRSLPDEIPGAPRLLSVADMPYLVAMGESGGTGTISVYAIDLANAKLTRLFDGGTRAPRASLNSMHLLADSRILLNIGGGHLVSLDLAEVNGEFDADVRGSSRTEE
jgi:hypothetical protein